MYQPNELAFLALSTGPEKYADSMTHALRLGNPADDVLQTLQQCCHQPLHNLRVAVWGVSLAFGSRHTDCSSLQSLLSALLQAGIRVNVHDPLAGRHSPAYRDYGAALAFCENRHAALAGTDALVVWNPSQAFNQLDIGLARLHMNQPFIIDMCQQFRECGLERHGVHYIDCQLPG